MALYRRHRRAQRPSTPPASLRTGFTSALGYLQAKDMPTHRPETILVQLAARPTIVRSWDAVLEWLPVLAGALDPDALALELAGRNSSDRVRAGYLLQGLRPDLATALKGDVAGPVRFGSRNATPLRYSRTWHVIDTLLPVDPAGLNLASGRAHTPANRFRVDANPCPGQATTPRGGGVAR
jgi:AbiEi antitoxin C-terminal domain